ncbi:M13 family metallopeptidase [Microvirga sp. STS02]|uniref:M13 family metallopeptidase n=1 Tax=Hymenobacter negativus TaxID=2795026 RepID=UPI0018DDF5EB|nr:MULTISPECIES: M13 family metallopeptidase [Bacteria]MBH8570277.1 M13 family metallopeptidase [Hymenobacter negativus]MBR7210016.1 M13 family metallopeptidase [Microvirga sp. STS02]
MKKPLFLLPLLAAAVTGCPSNSLKTASTTDKPDILHAALDTTVAPGDDFFTYANGTWLKNNPIPASESNMGIGKKVQDEIYTRLRQTSIEAADAKATAGSNQQKIGDFWAVGMDSVKADQLGATPLKPELDRIAALKTVSEVPGVIAHEIPLGVNALIGPRVGQDDKNSDKMALYLRQAGLGLPNRDYYFNTDSRTKNIRAEYLKHVANTFKLLGQDAATAQANAAKVMALETTLAKSSRKLEALRDPYANYHKMSIAQLDKLTPGIDWKTWLGQMGSAKTDTVIVGQPEFYQTVGQLLKTQPVDTWKAYLAWHVAHEFAPTLSRPFVDENFHFYGTVLRGATAIRPRWKRVLDMQENALGDALGQLFVKEYFKPEAKARYDTLVKNMVAAFAQHIQKLDWMSAPTKVVALDKLHKITPKVGYPNKWKDYSNLKIDRSSLAENVMRANEWQYNYQLNKLGKPVDRTEWDMTPQTYNAYYNSSNNEIVLPAAAFAVPGLLDADADDALVYGYAGASTIGHELTHGFDDEGSQYDAHGNLHEWWSKEDRKRFNERVNGIVKQFNGYTLLDSLHINGKATAGENIADLGGIVIGLDAFKKTKQYKEGKKINGLTPTQRYFLGYALGWQMHVRDESLASQLLTDVHSPAQYRVNGPMADVPAFYEAFGIKPGQKLYRPDSTRVVIW